MMNMARKDATRNLVTLFIIALSLTCIYGFSPMTVSSNALHKTSTTSTVCTSSSLFGVATVELPTRLQEERSLSSSTNYLQDKQITGRSPEKETEKKKNQNSKKDDSEEDAFWEIRVYNDEINTHEWVARCLVLIAGASEWQAYKTTKKAHLEGQALLGLYEKEVAEHYTDGLRGEGLVVQMFPIGPADIL